MAKVGTSRGGGWMIPDGLARELIRDADPLTPAEQGEIINGLLRLAMGQKVPIPAIFRATRETFMAFVAETVDARAKFETRKAKDRLRKQGEKPSSDSAGIDGDSAGIDTEGREGIEGMELKDRMTDIPSLSGRGRTHAGAAAGGASAAALPGASFSTPPNDAAQTSKPNGATPTRDGLDEIGSARQDTQDALEGLTRTDTQRERDEKAQQTDEAARLRTLPATVTLLRAAQIATTDSRYSALVEAVKAAGEKRGWTALRPIVEKHADAAAHGADALNEIRALLGEVSQ